MAAQPPVDLDSRRNDVSSGKGFSMMRQRWDWTGIALLLTIVVLAPHAFPQATIGFAQLSGTVLDSSGRTIAKASVIARNVDTNIPFTATTTGEGFYVIPNVPPGRYDVSASYSGFAKTTQTGIVLTVGQTATVNLTLKVAAAGETVLVTGEAPIIEPTKTEISQVIATQQIQSLPISGRLFTDFALLTPSVAKSRTSLGTTFTEFEVTQISFGGMRSFSNEITVDGAVSNASARRIAMAIANSPLVKTAWAGCDPNWGRILAAIGYAGVAIDPTRINISFGELEICRGGCISPRFDENATHEYLKQRDLTIQVDLGLGSGKCRFWTTDLTAEYVRINADYST